MNASSLSRFLDGIEPFEPPDVGEGLSLVCGLVADHADSLLSGEKVGLDRMGEGRAAEYSSGRRVAREALRLLGIGEVAITTRGRVPIWPAGIVGSITHSRTHALALVGWKRQHAGVGIDLEVEARVTRRIAERVLTGREHARFAGCRSGMEDWETLLFAAKEAVYKSVNPLIGEFLGFEDVEVTPCPDGTFTATTTRECGSTSMVSKGSGAFLHVLGHWLAVYRVPSRS